MEMKFTMFENEGHVYKYVTTDGKYCICQYCKKADWELAELTMHGRKVIKCFGQFNDAKQYLEEMLRA